MFNISKKLGLFALVCTLAGLVGCGGSSGTDKKAASAKLCGSFEIVLENGQCGKPPAPKPLCENGLVPNKTTGVCEVPTTPPPVYTPANDEVVIYVNIPAAEKQFGNYSLYLWQDCGNGWNSDQANGVKVGANSGWTNESLRVSSSTSGDAKYPEDPIYGAYFVLKTSKAGDCGNAIIRNGLTKQTSDLKINISHTGSLYERMYFVITDLDDMKNSKSSATPICINDICAKYETPALAINGVKAHWIDPTTILLKDTFTDVKLYKANSTKKITADASINAYRSTQEAGLQLVTDADLVATLGTAANLTPEQQTRVPHLSAYKAYSIALDPEITKAYLKGDLVVVWKDNATSKINQKNPDGTNVLDADGKPVEITTEKLHSGTRIQNSYLLDALYTGDAGIADTVKLGPNYDSGKPSVSVWAPTATNVVLEYGTPLKAEGTLPMTEDTATGIWTLNAYDKDKDGKTIDLNRKYYLFAVTVFNPVTAKFEKLETSDPSSVNLSANGLFSQFVNLGENSADLKPSGWDDSVVPEALSPVASSIYEVHVRDFSASNEDTPAAHRGKYLAFTDANSAPVKHLQALQANGLTHVHLLPVMDGASIPENSVDQVNLDSYVLEICARKGETDGGLCDFRDKSNRKKTIRSILEGYDTKTADALAVVNLMKDLDAFNWNYDPEHFNAPEGSYATDANGVKRIEEMREMIMALHDMGLRVVFDVVYPHMNAAGLDTTKSTFQKIVPGYYFRTNADTGLPLDQSGPQTAAEHPMYAKFISDSLVQWAEQYKVDGFRFDQSGRMPKSVLTNALAAVQEVDPDTYFYAEAWDDSAELNLRSSETRSNQVGLVGSGIGSFNDKLRDPLQKFALVNGGKLDPVRAGLAGNLKDFSLKAKSGSTIAGSDVGAYGEYPTENIVYADVHDNETLWDWMQKPNAVPAGTTLENRARIQNLTLSVPALSQGVPFFLMGSEMLRSKSMDGNSYNSGDWFNAVDFSMSSDSTNNWNVGLPVTVADADAILAAIIQVGTAPKAALMQKSSDVFNQFLAIRKSSPLFSLNTAAEIKARVGFHDGGIAQKDNVIVMSIDDGSALADLDPNYDAIVVVFNGTNKTVTQKIIGATGFTLHPLQQTATDPDATVDPVAATSSFAVGGAGDETRGLFTVPAYTTAVFVKAQGGVRSAGLSATATSAAVWAIPYGATDIYLRGTLTSTTTPARDGWAVTDSVNKLTYKSEGIYEAVVALEASTTPYEFKIADASWGVLNTAPLKSDGVSITLGEAKTFNPDSGDTGNAKLKITETGSYQFTVDATNKVHPILTVTRFDPLNIYASTPLYVRGDVIANAWSAGESNKMEYIGLGKYSKALPLDTKSYSFKIADADWTAGTNFGAGDVTLGDGLTDSGGNIGLSATSGTYIFTIDTTTSPKTVTVDKQ